MNEIVCAHCGCTEYTTSVKGIHTGAYCAKCGKWIKWLSHKNVPETGNGRTAVNNTTTHGYTVHSKNVPQVVKGTERMTVALSADGELSVCLDGTKIPVYKQQGNTAPIVVLAVGEQRIELPVGCTLDVYVM